MITTDSEHQPEILDPGRAADRQRLEELRSAGVTVRDTLRDQLDELVVTRDPSRDWTADEKSEAVRAHLGSRPLESYGRWVHYPWRDAVVHLLGPVELHELRTSRNRNKITGDEQARLRGLTLGVAGLSVGSSTALTLVQEGLGSEIRLADFDTLDLSNLNRLRATVLDIGLPKTVITARAIAELDPYVRVRLFDEGITDESIGPFLEGLDLLFEECDGLAMKLRLREEARRRRLPVLMETSDRGMIDVERFDLEPERPILHGLAGELRAADLEGLSTYEKVPAVLRIIGVDTMSVRLGASMPDIDTTLKTWPQLASAVALGGALNTDVARRIALGKMRASGRFFVDVSELVSDQVDGTVELPPVAPETTTPMPPEIPELLPRTDERTPTTEMIRRLAAFATLAPSGGNCQPWQLRWSAAHLDIGVHPERGATLLDHRRHASLLAVGAALENLCTAAAATGWAPEVETFPEGPAERSVVARVRFRPAEPDDDARRWLTPLASRVTNRKLGAERRPLPAGALDELASVARSMETALHVVSGDDALHRAGEVLAEGDRFRFLQPRLHEELLGEVRFTDEEVARTRDGIDLASLEMDPTQVAGVRMLRRRAFVDAMAAMDSGQGLGRSTRRAVAASSALVILRTAEVGPEAFLSGGRALCRVWARASDMGLAFQPLSALLYLFERLADGGEGLTEGQQSHLGAIRRHFDEAFARPEGGTDLLLFRLAPAPAPPTARSPRYAIDDVLRIGDDGGQP
jgi:molybdopterin/thiamine biosynthesis adenylyltransferase/nitroreductase